MHVFFADAQSINIRNTAHTLWDLLIILSRILIVWLMRYDCISRKIRSQWPIIQFPGNRNTCRIPISVFNIVEIVEIINLHRFRGSRIVKQNSIFDLLQSIHPLVDSLVEALGNVTQRHRLDNEFLIHVDVVCVGLEHRWRVQ